MKKLTLIFTLVFTVMFSSNSFAEWTKVSESAQGIMYVNLERIRKHDGYVYVWMLGDYKKQSNTGVSSAKTYNQCDCRVYRFKILSQSFYTERMGKGERKFNTNTPDKEWTYPEPNSGFDYALNMVCSN